MFYVHLIGRLIPVAIAIAAGININQRRDPGETLAWIVLFLISAEIALLA